MLHLCVFAAIELEAQLDSLGGRVFFGSRYDGEDLVGPGRDQAAPRHH